MKLHLKASRPKTALLPSSAEKRWYTGVVLVATAAATMYARGALGSAAVLAIMVAITVATVIRVNRPSAAEWVTSELTHWSNRRYTVRISEAVTIAVFAFFMGMAIPIIWVLESRLTPWRQAAGYLAAALTVSVPVYVLWRILRRSWRTLPTNLPVGLVGTVGSMVGVGVVWQLLGTRAYAAGFNRPVLGFAPMVGALGAAMLAAFCHHKWQKRQSYPPTPSRSSRSGAQRGMPSFGKKTAAAAKPQAAPPAPPKSAPVQPPAQPGPAGQFAVDLDDELATAMNGHEDPTTGGDTTASPPRTDSAAPGPGVIRI